LPTSCEVRVESVAVIVRIARRNRGFLLIAPGTLQVAKVVAVCGAVLVAVARPGAASAAVIGSNDITVLLLI
jgi:hypothetical protein